MSGYAWKRERVTNLAPGFFAEVSDDACEQVGSEVEMDEFGGESTYTL